MVNTLRSSDETKAKRKLHSSLVRGVQMKSTVARTLCPKDLEPLVVRHPATKEVLSDPADVAKVLGDTLLHLGEHPDYAPPKDFVEEVLSHSPTCPVSAKNDDIPPVTWQEFLNHLKHSKPSKAGGPDKTNNYILALCPEPIQRFLHSILNRFLHSPLPPHWLCAKICLLYKKGDPFLPSNYRPIALLNCIYNSWPLLPANTSALRLLHTTSFQKSSTVAFPATNALIICIISKPFMQNRRRATGCSSIPIKPLIQCLIGHSGPSSNGKIFLLPQFLS